MSCFRSQAGLVIDQCGIRGLSTWPNDQWLRKHVFYYVLIWCLKYMYITDFPMGSELPCLHPMLEFFSIELNWKEVILFKAKFSYWIWCLYSYFLAKFRQNTKHLNFKVNYYYRPVFYQFHHRYMFKDFAILWQKLKSKRDYLQWRHTYDF